MNYEEESSTDSLSEFEGATFLADGVVPKFDDYELIEEIDRGGMGIIYRAKQVSLERTVAIKTILAGQLATKESLQRFQLEATAAARLDHPGLVPIYEVGESQGQHFFSMKLIEGSNLATKMADFRLEHSLNSVDSREKQQRIARLMSQVADAVSYAHQHGVLHRDIKPNNILIDRRGEPYLTDFGLAKLTGHDSKGLTLTSTIVGSPSYMAPEQATSSPDDVTTAADVYGLGAVLYELLTGRPPFLGETALETVRQAAELDPVLPNKFVKQVHADLQTIALKCLEKRPEQRYSSAAEVADELGRFIDGKPILARPVSQFEHVSRWCRRNPWLTTSGVALLLVTLIGIAAVFYQWRVALTQRDLAEWQSYRANMTNATNALELHNLAALRRALSSASNQHRGWEWNYLQQQVDNSSVVLFENSDLVLKECMFDDDGTQLEATFHSTTNVWDTRTHQLVASRPNMSHRLRNQVSEGIGNQIDSSILSPDEQLEAQRVDGELRLVAAGSPETAAVLWKYAPEAEFVQATFSSDGQRVACWCDDDKIRIWDSSGRELVTCTPDLADVRAEGATGKRAKTFSAAFTPDDQRLISWSISGPGFRFATMFDVKSGERICKFYEVGKPHVSSTAFGTNGRLLVIGRTYPGREVELWDIVQGKRIGVMSGHENGVTSVSISPDASTIVSGSYDKTVRVWDVRTKNSTTLREHTGVVRDVDISPDGSSFASAGDDGTICIWELASKTLRTALIGHTAAVDNIDFGPNQLLASTSGDGTVRLWDLGLGSRHVLTGHTSFVYDVAVSPAGTLAASVAWNDALRIWNLDTGTEVASFEIAKQGAEGVAFSPDGTCVWCVNRVNRGIHCWSLEERKKLFECPVQVTNLFGIASVRPTFDPSGSMILCGTETGAIRFWNANTGELVRDVPGHERGVVAVLYTAAGDRLLSASYNSLLVRNAKSMETVAELTTSSELIAIALSPDDQTIVGATMNGDVHFWDARTYTELSVLKPGRRIYAMAFSPDGSRIAAGCDDGTVRIWDTAHREEITSLHGHNEYVHGITFTSDGNRIVSCSGDKTVRIWDATTK